MKILSVQGPNPNLSNFVVLLFIALVSSLQTLCRKAIQKHVVHRMAIDWLELPEALKHYCKYE